MQQIIDKMADSKSYSFSNSRLSVKSEHIRQVKIQNKAPFNEKPAAAEVALTDSEKK